jgi:hypothetical protein
MWKECQKKRTVKKVFKNIPEGKRSVGKPRKRWLEFEVILTLHRR